MKYRDPNTGEVFEEIEAARIAFCGMACQECKLSCWNNKDKTRCDIYCHAHPIEAAHLMGLEVITDKEEPMDKMDKPRFTKEEMADAMVLARALLADGFERDKGGDVFATSSVACRTLLDSEMFPSLRPGQAVKLEEIINATDG